MLKVISVKKVKLNFERSSLIVSYSAFTEIVNEKPMSAMINIKGEIFNLEETNKKVFKNGKTLQIRKAMFKDSTDYIPMTSQYPKAKGYQITSVCVSFFKSQRILKTIEITNIMEDHN